uniref:FYVE-type zinc finger domain-containing protein n=1 Tax=Anopheles darlingi TaxID=43151 RepID=A0A2M4CKG4_ANODA
MIIELSKFNDKLRRYRLLLEKLTADQPDYQRRRERLSKLSQRRRGSRKPDVVAAECYMCNANIELERPDSFATCRGCERLVCRGENCCQWVESIGIWECGGCQSNRVIQQKAGEWLLNQLTARLKQPGPVELKEGNLLGLGIDSDADTRSTVSVGSSSVSVNQRIKVREFIEELLSTMLHGSLDDVSVGQLMKNESYLPLWEGQQQHHSPSDQHFELKQLVQKILEEIAKLPELLNHSGIPLRPEEHLPYFDPKKYEQLLATAVLNKVVDDYRNPKNFVNVSTGDVAGKVPGELDINHNKVPAGGAVAASQRSLLNEGSLRQMSVAANVAARDPSSREPDDDEDEEYPVGERRLSDTDESYLSDYIQRHKVPLPDLSDTTGSGSGAEDDDLQSLKSNATDGTWEENWLFRKRQLKTTESSIAMLVPSPTEEVKALIGDKNADEISDLSEAGSDCEAGYESDGKAHDSSPAGPSKESTSEAISSSSKANDDSLDEQLPPDSLVSVNSLPGNETLLSEAKNSQLLGEQSSSQIPAGAGEAFSLMDDLISIGPVMVANEKVETKNTTLTNPFLDEPFESNNNVITDDVKLLQRTNEQATNDLRSSHLEPTVNGSCNRKEVPIDRAQIESTAESSQVIMSNGKGPANGHHTVTDEQQQKQAKEKEQDLLDREETLIPGSIAEREHLKWRNAKPIANNPYSPDALQRRLSEKSRPSSMIEIDRLVRKETAPNGDDGMMRIGDDDPSSEPRTDAGIDQERSAKVGALSEQKKIGREYYINDPERLRAGGGGCVKQTLGTRTHAHHQQSHSTDDEKVSHPSSPYHYHVPANSYIMDRFLNNERDLVSGTTTAGGRPSTVGRSPSLRSNRSHPMNEPLQAGHRAASVDLGYQTKTPSTAGSETAVDIPTHILAQFEQETLHSDYKRDSFRARHATTRQFVLNPIFDETTTGQTDESPVTEETARNSTFPRKSTRKTSRVAPVGSEKESGTNRSGPVVETVFTDLCTLRRSASVKSRIEQFSAFSAIRRTESHRTGLSK